MDFRTYLTERKSYSSMGANPFQQKVLRVFETGPGTNSGSPMLRHITQVDRNTFDFTNRKGDSATLILRSNGFVVYSNGKKVVDGSKGDDASFEALRYYVWGMKN